MALFVAAHRFVGACIAPTPHESAGRFTPHKKILKRAAPPQHCKDACPFVSLVSLSLLSLSRVFAHLSGRWVTCHLQARRQACTARVKRSETLPYRLTTRSLHSPATPAPSLAERLSPKGASRTQPGVSVALPPEIKARVSVYRASSARPAILCGECGGKCEIKEIRATIKD